MTTTEAAVPAPRTSPAQPTGEDTPTIQVGHGALLRALEQSLRDNSVSVRVAGLGTVRLPGLDSVAWIAGLGTLAALELLEWPVALTIGVGHVLAHQQHMRLLSDFGAALQEA